MCIVQSRPSASFGTCIAQDIFQFWGKGNSDVVRGDQLTQSFSPLINNTLVSSESAINSSFLQSESLISG